MMKKLVYMVKTSGKTHIAHFGGAWPTNIGNAFIDLGSLQSLRMAAPAGTVHLVSELPSWLFRRIDIQSRSMKHRILLKGIEFLNSLLARARIQNRTTMDRKQLSGREYVENCFDLINAMKLDYAVVSGMVFCEEFIKLFGSIFGKLKKNKVKIIINGGGGLYYSDEEIYRFRKFLERIDPYAIISRDEQTFRSYKDLAEYSFNGIDCAFFINNWFTPARLVLPRYVILNFDYHPEPELDIHDKLVIRTHHCCWSNIPKSHFSKHNTLISNLPLDYLNLYANTDATYSDRVHACVATLAFGHPYKFYGKTPRAFLLDKVGATTITHKLTYPNTKKIEKEKEKQLKFLSNILAN
ncbi:MAG: polysaccharide pyruvyl transferase family protein [Candidatus Hodarchaeota archaeon]